MTKEKYTELTASLLATFITRCSKDEPLTSSDLMELAHYMDAVRPLLKFEERNGGEVISGHFYNLKACSVGNNNPYVQNQN